MDVRESRRCHIPARKGGERQGMVASRRMPRGPKRLLEAATASPAAAGIEPSRRRQALTPVSASEAAPQAGEAGASSPLPDIFVIACLTALSSGESGSGAWWSW